MNAVNVARVEAGKMPMPNPPQGSKALHIDPHAGESARKNIFRLTRIRETNRIRLGVIIDQPVMQ